MKLQTSLLALAFLVGCAEADEDFDGVPASLDCNDNDNLIFPGAVEMCDGIDNDCNGVEDDDYARGGQIYYVDADADGFGATSATVESCLPPVGFVANAKDCDDTVATINPDASETCNLSDDNCNGRIDDDATDAPSWHADWDQDGYGSQTLVKKACEAPEGYISDSQDCNDFDRFTNPLADETCDFLDNNCDGAIDEDTAVDAREWYGDVDGDGYGDIASPKMACWQPAGFSIESTDCDDTTGAVNPGAAEVCRDGLDNNCNDSADHCSVEAWQSVDDATLVWKGKDTYDYLGYEVDFVGDVDGDGFEDFVASAYSADFGSYYSAGVSYLIWGEDAYEPSLTARPVTALPGFSNSTSYSYFGRATSPAGDVDGDGYADFLVGGDSAGGSQRGTAVLFYGGATRFSNGLVDATDDNPYFQGDSRYYCGSAVYGGFDLDGDGYDDISMGCRGYSSYSGGVFVYAGGSSRLADGYETSDAAASWKGSGTYAYLGGYEGSLSGGDFDGDGNADLLLGSSRANTDYGSYTGAAYIMYGDGTMPSGEGDVGDLVTIAGTTRYDYTGQGLGTVGDLNDDGYEDIGVGCYYCNSGGTLYVFWGDATQLVSTDTEEADVVVSVTSSYAYLGRNSPTFGDFDGDGIDDLAVGAYGEDSVSSYNGGIWVLAGDAALAGEYNEDDVTVTIAGPAANSSYFGSAVSAGDFNGDGFTDLIGGAYRDQGYTGGVYFFEGTSL